MKKIIDALLSNLDITNKKIERLFQSVSALILFFSFSIYVGILFSFSTHRSILNSYDDDSSYGVETAIKTNWINHNGSTTYGPLYYRLVTPIKFFLSNKFSTEKLSVSENIEKNVHFFLLVVNLISVFLCSYFLLSLITDSKKWLFIGTALLSQVFLINEFRSLMLLMAKPDWLLSFLIIIAILKSFQWHINPSSINLKQMSLFWALSSLAKLITLFFAPSLIYLLWVTPFISVSEHIKYRFLHFILWLCLFYFAIGFPQSLDIPGYIRYLIQQNSHTSFIDLEFLMKNWIPLFYQDLLYPFIFLFFFSLFAPKTKKGVFKNSRLKPFFIFSLLSFILIISKKTTDPFQWYTFSFTHALLIVACFEFIKFRDFIEKQFLIVKKLISFIVLSPKRIHFYEFFMFLCLGFISIPISNKNLEKHFQQGMSCRADAEEAKIIIDEYAHQRKKILVDPYFPYDQTFHNHEIKSHWDSTLELLTSGAFTIIGLNQKYYSRYLPNSHVAINYLTDLRPVEKFYSLFANQSEVVDPSGHKWQKIKSNTCGFEIWKIDL